MDVVVDQSEFDKNQNVLAGQIAARIHDAIKSSKPGLTEREVIQMTHRAAFSVCSLIDNTGTTHKKLKGGTAGPVIAFAKGRRKKSQELIIGDTPSFMHEYVGGWIYEEYESKMADTNSGWIVASGSGDGPPRGSGFDSFHFQSDGSS